MFEKIKTSLKNALKSKTTVAALITALIIVARTLGAPVSEAVEAYTIKIAVVVIGILVNDGSIADKLKDLVSGLFGKAPVDADARPAEAK